MSGSASAAAPDPGGSGKGRGANGTADQQAAAPPPAEGQPPEQPPRGQGPAQGQPAPAQPPAQGQPAHEQGQPAQGRPPAAAAAPRSAPPWARDPHADFLITSTDREVAEARLRQAVADEALTLDEFGDRMRAVLEARTRGDLQEATAGIPLAAEPRRRTRERGTARPAPRHQHVVAIMSESSTRGRWRPADETTALAVMGSAIVDLQGAEYEGDELKINAVAWMGSVEIIVPEGVEVELSGFAIMGDRSMKVSGEVFPDAPLVRVDAYAVMGSVEVRHPKPKERLETGDDRGAFADRVPLRSADEIAAGRGATRARRGRSPVAAKLRQWAVTALAAAALLVPLGWTLSSDQVTPAVFGSADTVVSTQGLEAGEELTVGAPVAFGAVAIQVPEGVNVERDGLVIFGSTECPACGTAVDPDAPTVRVRTVGGFGSIEIQRVGAPGAGLD